MGGHDAAPSQEPLEGRPPPEAGRGRRILPYELQGEPGLPTTVRHSSVTLSHPVCGP